MARLLLAGGLLLCSSVAAAAAATEAKPSTPPATSGPFEIKRLDVPPARGNYVVRDAAQTAGTSSTARSISIDVALAEQARVDMESIPYWLMFAGGAASVPLALLNPFYALGVFLPFVGTPLNAVFNRHRETLAAAVAAEPLPAALLTALLNTPELGRSVSLQGLEVRIFQYGLVARQGKPLSALSAEDELCLAVAANVVATRADQAPQTITLQIGRGARDPAAPPPLCAPLARFAADNARLLRQSIRELAEVMAALTALRLEQPA